MLETKLQKFLVDEVRDSGGFAHKMSNRFLIGVPDLLIKLPNSPATFLETKQHTFNNRDAAPAKFWLRVTPLQAKFLRDANAAGVPGLVGSFVQFKGRTINDVLFAAYPIKAFSADNEISAELRDHKSVRYWPNVFRALCPT